MSNFVDRTGEIHISKEGCEFEIIKCTNNHNCDIRFNDSHKHIIKGLSYGNIKNGQVKNPYHPSVAGVGYIGVGKYDRTVNGKSTIAYRTWLSMIDRSYAEKSQNKYPAYNLVTVCDNWHNYQNFAEWHEKNYIVGSELDKDFLCYGNKIYSPDTCCFLPKRINLIFKAPSKKGKSFIGVMKVREDAYEVRINKNGVNKYVGSYKNENIASEVYNKERETQIRIQTEVHKDRMSQKIYNLLINYKSSIK